MKYEDEKILSTVVLCALLALALVVAICVIAGNIKAALIAFVPALVCAVVSNAFAYDEYVVVEYYYEEDELD